jgi:hypothetical protein
MLKPTIAFYESLGQILNIAELKLNTHGNASQRNQLV